MRGSLQEYFPLKNNVIFLFLPQDKESPELMMSKNKVKSLLFRLYNEIDISEEFDINMKKLKELFDLLTTIKLLKYLQWHEHDLIKS